MNRVSDVRLVTTFLVVTSLFVSLPLFDAIRQGPTTSVEILVVAQIKSPSKRIDHVHRSIQLLF